MEPDERAGPESRLDGVVGLLPIGTRIRFTKTLTAPATGDHPAYIYAREGDGGTITGHDTREGYWVRWDKWPHAFGASRDEFEPDEDQQALDDPGVDYGMEQHYEGGY